MREKPTEILRRAANEISYYTAESRYETEFRDLLNELIILQAEFLKVEKKEQKDKI